MCEFKYMIIGMHDSVPLRLKDTRPGTHEIFCDFVQGKHWLVYFHERLSECECDGLMQLASPSLQPNVLSSTIDTKGMIFFSILFNYLFANIVCFI